MKANASNIIVVPSHLKGRIKLNAVKDHQVRPLTPWFPNIVLNTGLNFIGQSNTYLDCCCVGSATDTPIASQTTLSIPVGSTDNRTAAVNPVVENPPYYGISRISYEFPTGAVTGRITEIGFGPSIELGSDLFNRALIKDEFGDVTYALVTSDEALQCQYELSITVIEEMTGTIMHDGQEIGYTVRPAFAATTDYWSIYKAENFAESGQAVQAHFNTEMGDHIQAFTTVLGDPDEAPAGAGAPARWIHSDDYVPGSYKKLVYAEWDLNDAVFENGIRSILWYMGPIDGSGGNTLGAYQIEFDTPILKTSDQSFFITLGISWART